MKIVFVHQNFPGQFVRLARSFVADGHEVVGLGTDPQPAAAEASKYFAYDAVPGPEDAPYENRYSPVVPRLRRSYGAAHLAMKLREAGLQPDLVVVNTGWGENLFLKDVWPEARHVAYFEYYYAANGQDLDFDPEFPVTNPELVWRLRVKNAMQLGALDAADLAVAPTRYQRDTFPAYLRDRVEIIHDGIDANALEARTRIRDPDRPDGSQAQPGRARSSPIVTRNIEPMRGAHIVFRALPHLLASIRGCRS